MTALEIFVLPALADNYIYVLRDRKSNNVAAVDPSNSEVVSRFLREHDWPLHWVLNTHHHWDHTGGNAELKEEFGCQIVGPSYDRHRIVGLTTTVSHGDIFRFGVAEFRVKYIPGHTLGHIAYWSEKEELLFSGDTLFSLGCGRLFEGTPEQMWSSLNQLALLPPTTQIYCGHEYTLKNGQFAMMVDPDNRRLKEKMQQVQQLRRQGKPTVPTSMEDELACNPFLTARSLEEFTHRREARNRF